MNGWVYIQSEPRLWTVGHYDQDGKFRPESDHGSADEAARRVHSLNGGTDEKLRAAAIAEAKAIEKLLEDRVRHLAALRQIANMTETGGNPKGGYDIYHIALGALADAGRRSVNREASLRNERAEVGLPATGSGS